jgi:hypothetical protein
MQNPADEKHWGLSSIVLGVFVLHLFFGRQWDIV